MRSSDTSFLGNLISILPERHLPTIYGGLRVWTKGDPGILNEGTMIDRKKPGVAFWTTVVVVMALVAYPVSFGPACWISSRLESLVPAALQREAVRHERAPARKGQNRDFPDPSAFGQQLQSSLFGSRTQHAPEEGNDVQPQ